MLETPEEMDGLQQLLDRSAAAAGPHLRGIITDDRRLSAVQVCQLMQGLRLLVVATVRPGQDPLQAAGRRLLPGIVHVSSGRNSPM